MDSSLYMQLAFIAWIAFIAIFLVIYYFKYSISTSKSVKAHELLVKQSEETLKLQKQSLEILKEISTKLSSKK